MNKNTQKTSFPILLQQKHIKESNMLQYLLPDDIIHNAAYVDTFHCHRLNNSVNMFSLLHKNSLYRTCSKFIKEGLIKTYPTEIFQKAFEKLVNSHVPIELKSLTFKDFGLDDFGDEAVYLTTDKTKEVDEISGQIAFLIPIYQKDEAVFKKFLDASIKSLYVNGYLLTSIEKLQHSKLLDIDILILQFEAKYPTGKFELADVLLHIAPYKYFEKIKKMGLVPKSKSSEFNYDSRIYLFNQCKESLAIDYGKFKAKQVSDTKFCVFKILKSKLEADPKFKSGQLAFYVDYAFETDTNIEAIFTYGNIPLNLLENECLIIDCQNNSQVLTKLK